MKGFLLLIVIMPVFFVSPGYFHGDQNETGSRVIQDTVITYHDGIWEGTSQASYTDEPYWGKARLIIRNGRLTDIFFMVRDSNLHETFDAKYEKHFEGNPEYIQQSRNDWRGVQLYPGKLMKSQDLNKVDAMTGATWSYNIFRSSVEDALKKAR